MLTFMRKHAVKILGITLTFFVLSIVIPVILQNMRGGGGAKRSSQTIYQESGVAYVDEQPININKLYQEINRGMRSAVHPQQKAKIDPRLRARIMYSSLQKAIEHALILKDAKKNKIKAGRSEVNRELEGIKNSYKVKSNKELEKLLKSNGYSLDSFRKLIKEEIMVQKMLKKVRGDVTVTDEDIKNKFKQVKARHILIVPRKKTAEKEGKDADKVAKAKADEIYESLKKGEDFIVLAQRFSADRGSAENGGDLGWFKQGDMVQEFEAAAFSMGIGELSKPVKTVFGYHIIEVQAVATSDIPLDVDEAELKKEMLDAKRKRVINNWYSYLYTGSKIKVTSKPLLAFKNQSEGKFVNALREYKLLGGSNPNDPLGHLFIAQVYEDLGKPEEAAAEYEKSLVKIKISPAFENPFIHQAYGSLQLRRGKKAQGIKELKKAEALAEDNLFVYEVLKAEYEDNGYSVSAKRMDRKIEELKTLFSANLENELAEIEKTKAKEPEAVKTEDMPEIPLIDDEAAVTGNS